MTTHDTHSDTPSSATIAADWLPRIGLAAIFLFHGISKFGNLEGGAEMMGLSVTVWTLVAAAELSAGLGFLAGGAMPGRLGDVVSRLAGVAIVPVMLGAIFMVHWPRWNFTPSETHPMGGMEFQVLLLLLGLAYAIRGNAR